MKNNLYIGFVGLTHLGLNYLAASAEKKFKILGVDLNTTKINNLKKFDIEYNEPKLKNLITKNKRNIKFSSDLVNLQRCQIVFVSQDTTTDHQDKSDFNSLKKLINKTSKFLNNKSIMVILSQTKPGFTRTVNFDHDRLYYQVETLILGDAVRRALRPERFMIGCENPESEINHIFLNYLYKFNCPIIKMNYESAELAKISINLLLSSSINTSNILAEICEKIDANWGTIVPALQLDRRIGKHAYIKPGLGISGGNLERDIRTTIEMTKKYEVESNFFKSILSYSKKRKNWVWEKLVRLGVTKKKGLRIAVLGLAYKENTNSIKNSAAIALIKKLIRRHYVTAYDPAASDNIRSKNFKRTSSSMEAINNANVVILMTPWSEFRLINVKKLANLMQGKTIIDPFKVLDKKRVLDSSKNYYSLGN